jgi:hypothetical protein
MLLLPKAVLLAIDTRNILDTDCQPSLTLPSSLDLASHAARNADGPV